METETKRCPYCGEEVNAKATKCVHCGEWITETARQDAQSKDAQKQKEDFEQWKAKRQEEKKKEDEQGCASLALILFVYLAVLIGIVAAIFHFTIPSQTRMERAILEDVYDCIKDESTSTAGLFGAGVSALTSVVFDLGVSKDKIYEAFYQNNIIDIEEGWFWSTGKIYNNDYSADGSLACFGILGMVFPCVDWEDFIIVGDETSNYAKDSNNSSTEYQLSYTNEVEMNNETYKEEEYSENLVATDDYYNESNSDNQTAPLYINASETWNKLSNLVSMSNPENYDLGKEHNNFSVWNEKHPNSRAVSITGFYENDDSVKFSIEGYVDYNGNDFYLVGTYHIYTKVWLDANGYYNSDTNCLVLNLGHSEDKTFSQAVMYYDSATNTYKGVWGKKHEKPICITIEAHS